MYTNPLLEQKNKGLKKTETLDLLVIVSGFEPLAYRLGGGRSIQLSYTIISAQEELYHNITLIITFLIIHLKQRYQSDNYPPVLKEDLTCHKDNGSRHKLQRHSFHIGASCRHYESSVVSMHHACYKDIDTCRKQRQDNHIRHGMTAARSDGIYDAKLGNKLNAVLGVSSPDKGECEQHECRQNIFHDGESERQILIKLIADQAACAHEDKTQEVP